MEKKYKKIKINEWRIVITYEVNYRDLEKYKRQQENLSYAYSYYSSDSKTFGENKYVVDRLPLDWWWYSWSKKLVDNTSLEIRKEVDKWLATFDDDRIKVISIDRNVKCYKHKEVIYKEVVEQNNENK